jgi:hypothetical protein
MKIEEGIDKDGKKCWFLLEDANLIGIFYSYEEASNYKINT